MNDRDRRLPAPGPEPSDADLVAAIRAGDRAALAAVYDRYADPLHDFCHSVLRDRDEAADAVHDAFLLAVARLPQLRDPERLRPWLYAIARNEALARIRVRRRMEPVEAVPEMSAPPGSADDPQTAAEQAELRRLVWSAAAGLAPRDRMVLDLHLRQGLEGEELAEAMGIGRNQAYVLLSRLRDQVERALGAFLIARLGRDDCPALQRILEGWDGAFSPLVRKRVARHVEQCETCGARRRALVSPLGVLSAVPLFPAPASLRARVLDDIRLTSAGEPAAAEPRHPHTGAPAPPAKAAATGAPPPDAADSERRRRAAVLLGLLLLLLVAGAGLWAWQHRGPDGPTVADTSPTPSPVPAAPGGGASVAPGGGPGPTGAPSPKAASAGVGASPATAPSPTAATASPAPDRSGPVIGAVSANRLRIWEAGRRGTCPSAPDMPTTMTVTAPIDDPSSVATAELRWSTGTGSGVVPMRAAPTGGWEGTIGPLGLGTVPAGQGPAVLAIEVRATDGAGNVARTAGPEGRIVDCATTAVP